MKCYTWDEVEGEISEFEAPDLLLGLTDDRQLLLCVDACCILTVPGSVDCGRDVRFWVKGSVLRLTGRFDRAEFYAVYLRRNGTSDSGDEWEFAKAEAVADCRHYLENLDEGGDYKLGWTEIGASK